MSADSEVCGVRWCEEVAGHPGPHRRNLFDVVAVDVPTWRPAICQLWLQGESARVRACVLITGSREVGLTWRQAAQLADQLARAHRRYVGR